MALNKVKLAKGKYAILEEKGLRFLFNWKRNVVMLKISPKEMERMVNGFTKRS